MGRTFQRYITLDKALLALAALIKSELGVSIAGANAAVRSDGATWINFDDIRDDTGEVLAERIIGKLWPEALDSGDARLTNEVLIGELYDHGPVEIVSQDEFATRTDRPLPFLRYALVPIGDQVEARLYRSVQAFER